MRRLDNGGNASLLGFLAATVVFVATFATVVQVSMDREGEGARSLQADRQAVAASLADLLLANPGRGWYSLGAPCDDGVLNVSAWSPEAVTRVGLGEERCAVGGEARERVGNLSFDKLRNLHRAALRADPTNGAVDYEEARRSLHLDEARLDFHLRSWPLLPDAERMLKQGYRDPYLLPLYLADYDRKQGNQPPPAVPHTAGYEDGPNALTLWVAVTNDGTQATAFSVAIDVPARRSIVAELHTGLVAPGATARIEFVLNKTSTWQWKDSGQRNFAYVVRDPSTTLGSGQVAIPDPVHAQARNVYTVESGKLEWLRKQGAAKVTIAYGGFDGAGTAVNVNNWVLEIRNPQGDVIAFTNNLKTKGGTHTFTISSVGEHAAVLRTTAGWVLQTDVVNVRDAPFDTYNAGGGSASWDPGPMVPIEAAFIEALISSFGVGVPDPAFDGIIPYFPEGDVYPDDNRLLANRLPAVLLDAQGYATLDHYNILIVGSDVDHRTMTSAAIKHTIRDWVLAGGTLVVFGSSEQAVQWLEPLFHVALNGAGGELTTPDQNHPLLNTPNKLDHQNYDDHDSAWRFKRAEDRQYFSHVVLKGSDSVLAVSDPGAFGAGRIILTSWQPWDLVPGGSPACDVGNLQPACPGLQLLLNFITLAYHGLYLDYGPAIPDNVAVGVQSRLAHVYHPQMKRMVELFVLVYAFG
jgi:hypothetical protein